MMGIDTIELQRVRWELERSIGGCHELKMRRDVFLGTLRRLLL